MSDPDRDPVSESDILYDDWPVAGRDEYDNWDVERATPREQDGTTEELAEMYEAELIDEEIEWIGFTGGHGSGSPLLYSPREFALYEGELDEESERVILREASRYDVDEESLGDHIEEIGEEHGWEWLSSFARKFLETDAYERPAFEHRTSEFQQRNVAEADPYDLAFFGSHTFADESGRIHSIERFFDAYLDDASDVIRVEITEEYLIAEEPAEERRAGDAEMVDENEREIDVHVDTEAFGRESELADRLERWHSERAGWPRET